MILARCHVEFMQTRCYPRFASRVLLNPPPGDAATRRALVNRCVNAHAGALDPSHGYRLQNMLALLELWRKNQRRAYGRDRQTLAQYLSILAVDSQCATRRNYAKRWLRKYLN